MKEWIIGRNPVYEIIAARRRQVFRLLVAEGAQEKGRLLEILQQAVVRRIPVERAPRSRLDSLGENAQGVALETEDYPYADLADILALAHQQKKAPFLLLLDLIQNPQNLGTLLRTAEACGVHGVVLPFRQAALVTPAVVSASAGASENLLIAQANLAQVIDTIKKEDIWVVGLEDSSDAQPPEMVRLEGPLALVVGNEGEGMRPLVRRSCDLLMRLPMRGKIDSLNAAVAGSIALYLATRGRE